MYFKCTFSVAVSLLQKWNFSNYTGHLVSSSKFLRPSSSYKRKAKLGKGHFFIRASTWILRLRFLQAFFDKKPVKWSSSKSFINFGVFLLNFYFSTILVRIFWDILIFNFRCHHKWNVSWLLIINIVYTSFLTSYRTT